MKCHKYRIITYSAECFITHDLGFDLRRDTIISLLFRGLTYYNNLNNFLNQYFHYYLKTIKMILTQKTYLYMAYSNWCFANKCKITVRITEQFLIDRFHFSVLHRYNENYNLITMPTLLIYSLQPVDTQFSWTLKQHYRHCRLTNTADTLTNDIISH